MNKVLIQRNKTDNLENTYIAPVENHWEPDIGEVYFYIVYPSLEIRSAEFTTDDNFKIHQTRIINGNCFKSYDSAVAKLEAEAHNKEVDKEKRKSSFNLSHNMDMIQNMFMGVAESEYKRGFEDGIKEGCKREIEYDLYDEAFNNMRMIKYYVDNSKKMIKGMLEESESDRETRELKRIYDLFDSIGTYVLIPQEVKERMENERASEELRS